MGLFQPLNGHINSLVKAVSLSGQRFSTIPICGNH